MSVPLRERRGYYDDAYRIEFDGRIEQVAERDGRPAVALAHTFFYPESGGQLADRGTLGGANVLDVQADGEGLVWHVLEREASGADDLPGRIHWIRRFDFMQQHTGQHVLSAAFERVLDAATVSSRLGEDRCTVDIAMDAADWKAVARVEEATNRVLWEDRPVERHWVDAEGVKRFALRKAPKVTGEIRVVEIPEWDVSACGGTHTRRTGEVGVVKILGWEKVRDTVRFEFLCGERALRDHAWRTEAMVEAARRRTLKDRDLLEHLERALEDRDRLRKELADLKLAALQREAVDAVGAPPGPVAYIATERARSDLRTFAIQCLEAGAPWVVAATRAPEPALIVARASSGQLDLKSLLPELLERSGGKGGGNPAMIQVSAEGPAEAERAFEWLVERLRETPNAHPGKPLN